MEPAEWIGLFFVLTPVWGGLVYGILRLTGRWQKPEGVPPGRHGGMGTIMRLPGGDAPAYAQRLKRESEEDVRKETDGGTRAGERDPGPEG